MLVVTMTFAEAYCLVAGCPESRFARKVFWSCLHGPAIPLVPVITLLQPGYFNVEAQLIAHAGRATSLRLVDEEIRVFRSEFANQRWPRRGLRLRISTRRLRRLAAHCFTVANDAAVSNLASA